jgi:hypothetical protein
MKIIQEPRASAILYNLLISQGSERPWLLPANICPIVPITFLKAGVPIEFVDISTQTLHMDREQVEGCLKRGNYGGLLYAHTYGEPSTPTDFFMDVKNSYPEVLVVDDRCLCEPDLEPNHDEITDMRLYSTGYAKPVELNFGGYAFLSDDIPYQHQHLPYKPQAYEEVENEYKDAVQNRIQYVYKDNDWLQTDADLPAWYDYSLKIGDGIKTSREHRAALNAIYEDFLPTEIQLPREYQSWRFNLCLKNKDKILDAIFSIGLFASSHYASLAGIMAPGQGSQAENLAGVIINLFNDHHFDSIKAEKVCKVIMENLS